MIVALTSAILVDCMWIMGYVPNHVIEVAEREKSSMVRPGSSAWRCLRVIDIFMFTDYSCLEVSLWSIKNCYLCKLMQPLIVTHNKSINSLYANVNEYLDISEKSHVSRLYNSVNSQPIFSAICQISD